jgi:uncharacterized SAM-binding protein YcdF (DUF218 family)
LAYIAIGALALVVLCATSPFLILLKRPFEAHLGVKGLPAAIVVLGSRVHEDGRLGTSARERLDRAIELCRRFPSAELVLMGGRGSSGAVEALALRRVAVDEHRLEPGRIVLETASTSTWEQSVWLRRQAPRRWSRLVVVTSSYHSGRVARLLGGAVEASYLTPRSERFFDGGWKDRMIGAWCLAREAAAWGYYWLEGRLGFSSESTRAPARR